MAVNKKIPGLLLTALILALAVWLFFYEQAAKPGQLSSVHQDIDDCRTCHIPWHGVNEDMCLQCHEFGDIAALDPRVRFHEAEKYCLKCHREHLGSGADISRVDHTLFNGQLFCSRCHLDPHNGLFGNDCRQCHGLSTWTIVGFRHPPEDRKNCARCHHPPRSHDDPMFRANIGKGHLGDDRDPADVSLQECWVCHITHRWPHLKMDHGL